MDIIMPCAGRSTRFPDLRPKYLLTNYNGQLMIERSLNSLQYGNTIHIVILREHDVKFESKRILEECFGDAKVNIIILDEPTNGPAETVLRAIEEANITEKFLVKDCDSYFDFRFAEGNAAYTAKLSDYPTLKNVSQLGYVISNDQGIISSLIEKRIVSDNFCVGGYQFSNPELYKIACQKLSTNKKEIFLSDIIDYMIMSGEVFINTNVDNYFNVGTLDAWREYNNKPTILCDIDGVLIKNKGQYGKNSYHTDYELLHKNHSVLVDKHARGFKIVFVTARKKKYYDITRNMLDNLGFSKCDLLMEIHHSKRIIINDYSNSNPYPSAEAINIQRDIDNLGDFI